MKKITIRVKKSWNGTIEGGYIGNDFIWNYQFDDVVKDYEKEGYQVVLKDYEGR